MERRAFLGRFGVLDFAAPREKKPRWQTPVMRPKHYNGHFSYLCQFDTDRVAKDSGSSRQSCFPEPSI